MAGGRPWEAVLDRIPAARITRRETESEVPVMDGYEIAERAHALPDTFADRLESVDLAAVREYAEVGEWGEEIDLLLASLRAGQRSVTLAERTELIALLEAMGMTTEAVDALKVRSA
jgi:hypothetical protein